MWEMVRGLTERGVTIILTTHYIEEAEEMANRVGVMNQGQIILVEETDELLDMLGKKQLTVHLQHPLSAIPTELTDHPLELSPDGLALIYTYDGRMDTGIAGLLRRLADHGIDFKALQSRESSLEEIFVDLVRSN